MTGVPKELLLLKLVVGLVDLVLLEGVFVRGLSVLAVVALDRLDLDLHGAQLQMKR